jgi:hypothetical protein
MGSERLAWSLLNSKQQIVLIASIFSKSPQEHQITATTHHPNRSDGLLAWCGKLSETDQYMLTMNPPSINPENT